MTAIASNTETLDATLVGGVARKTAAPTRKRATTRTQQVAVAKMSATEAAQEVHPLAIIISLCTYIYMMGVYWLLFFRQEDSAFVVAISTVLLIVYAGTPLALYKASGYQPGNYRFSDYMRGTVATYTGHIKGWEALVQIITIPIALALCTTGIGFAIWRTM